MKKICACQEVDDKGSKMVFRIVRQGKDGNYKNHDFEATAPVASEFAPYTLYSLHVYVIAYE